MVEVNHQKRNQTCLDVERPPLHGTEGSGQDQRGKKVMHHCVLIADGTYGHWGCAPTWDELFLQQQQWVLGLQWWSVS